MSYISVTNTFSNNTIADASLVNQNFTDITNNLANNSKDIYMATVNASFVVAINDIYRTPKTDWSASINPSGFSSYTTKNSWYKSIGKTVIFHFEVFGPSNATTFTVQLPVAPQSGIGNHSYVVPVYDNGGAMASPGMIYLTASATTAIVTKTCAGYSSSWTGSSLKAATGTIIYDQA